MKQLIDKYFFETLLSAEFRIRDTQLWWILNCGGGGLIYIREGIPLIHLVDDNEQRFQPMAAIVVYIPGFLNIEDLLKP